MWIFTGTIITAATVFWAIKVDMSWLTMPPGLIRHSEDDGGLALASSHRAHFLSGSINQHPPSKQLLHLSSRFGISFPTALHHPHRLSKSLQTLCDRERHTGCVACAVPLRVDTLAAWHAHYSCCSCITWSRDSSFCLFFHHRTSVLKEIDRNLIVKSTVAYRMFTAYTSSL